MLKPVTFNLKTLNFIRLKITDLSLKFKVEQYANEVVIREYVKIKLFLKRKNNRHILNYTPRVK